MTQLPPAFVINCKPHVRRRELAAFRFRHLSFSFFPGVLGDDVYADFIRYQRGRAAASDTSTAPVIANQAAFACLIAHRNLYRHVLQENIDEVLIFEDDVYLAHDFVPRCRALLARPETAQYDCLYLGSHVSRYSPRQQADLDAGRPIIDSGYDPMCLTYGTYAMRLTRKALQQVLNYLDYLPIENYAPIDILFGRMHRGGGIRAGTANPQLALPDVRDSAIRGGRDWNDFLGKRGINQADFADTDVFDLYYHVKNQQPNYFSTEPAAKWVESLQAANNNNFFVFIIPAYNAGEWCERNLASIASQTYTQWRAVYIDDGSQDNTTGKAYAAAKKLGIENKISFWQLEENHGPAYARFLAYSRCHPREICCMLDGDDWLQDVNTLRRLNDVYNNGYNMTYGSAVTYEHGAIQPDQLFPRHDYAPEVHEQKTYRSEPWLAQHLRTMRADLLLDLPVTALYGPDNQIIRCCTDMAESFYCLEQPYCRPKHVAEPVYVYNKDNSLRYPLSYYRRDEDSQIAEYRQMVEQFVRQPRD